MSRDAEALTGEAPTAADAGPAGARADAAGRERAPEPARRHAAHGAPRPAAPSLAALRLFAASVPTAVALLAQVRGSTPREEGAWMIVTPDQAIGTIGGGEAERRTVEAARALLAGTSDHEVLRLPLGPQLDQCCGGHMTVALARINGAQASGGPPGTLALWQGGPVIADKPAREVYLYGAGHVGAALMDALAPLPFAVRWFDARAESLWPTPGRHRCTRLALPETAVPHARDDAFHVVMTHSHAVDLEIVAAILSRPFAFCGLIGSATKRATFERRLAERGIGAERLTSPIGLAAVRGKEPAVIAAGVAAQLIAVDRPGQCAEGAAAGRAEQAP